MYRYCRLYSEVVSFWWSKIWVWQISTDSLKCHPFGFYRHYTAEKQWYRSTMAVRNSLSIGCVSHTYMNENVKQSEDFVKRIYKKRSDRQLWNSWEDTAVCCMLFRVIWLNSASLVVHSNALREWQNNSLIKNMKLFILCSGVTRPRQARTLPGHQTIPSATQMN